MFSTDEESVAEPEPEVITLDDDDDADEEDDDTACGVSIDNREAKARFNRFGLIEKRSSIQFLLLSLILYAVCNLLEVK